jgi:hypothetical protein
MNEEVEENVQEIISPKKNESYQDYMTRLEKHIERKEDKKDTTYTQLKVDWLKEAMKGKNWIKTSLRLRDDQDKILTRLKNQSNLKISKGYIIRLALDEFFSKHGIAQEE